MVGTTIEFDTILEACDDQHRRIVLSELASETQAVTMDEMTALIARHNHHTPLAAVSEAETTQIQIALVHTHIPKLEALSLVEYDQERQRVTPTPLFEQVEPELTAIIEADPEFEAPTVRETV